MSDDLRTYLSKAEQYLASATLLATTYYPIMRNVFILVVFMVLGTSISCAQKNKIRSTKNTAQGLCGTVIEKRGNQMPSPDRPQSAGAPVVREVAVFPLLTSELVASDGNGFITDFKGVQPVKTVRSATNGTFCFRKLPAGRYSVLVHEPKGWYANLYDTQNHINPVTVEKGKTAQMTIQITHRAAF